MNKIILELTEEEIKMLLEIINAVSFQGNSVERIYQLKVKIKLALDSALDNKKSKTDGKE